MKVPSSASRNQSIRVICQPPSPYFEHIGTWTDNVIYYYIRGVWSRASSSNVLVLKPKPMTLLWHCFCNKVEKFSCLVSEILREKKDEGEISVPFWRAELLRRVQMNVPGPSQKPWIFSIFLRTRHSFCSRSNNCQRLQPLKDTSA
jgi:hypothetical protein